MKPYSDAKGNSIMGTGLITIYKIVKEHNGIMTISSELDVGTKIRIIFVSCNVTYLKRIKPLPHAQVSLKNLFFCKIKKPPLRELEKKSLARYLSRPVASL